MVRRFYPHEIGDMLDTAPERYVDMLRPYMTEAAARATAKKFLDQAALDKNDIAWLKRVSEKAVTFDFTGVVPTLEDVQYADETFRSKALRLPFPVCWLLHASKTNEKGHYCTSVLEEPDAVIKGFLIAHDTDSDVFVSTIFTDISVDKHSATEFLYPLATTLSPNGKDEFEWYSYITDEAIRERYGSDAKFGLNLGRTVGANLAYLAMLRHKEYAKEHHPAPIKLNAKRLKQRKPMIGPRYLVRIPIGGQAPRGTPITDPSGTERTFYGRRGHERTYRHERYTRMRGQTQWINAVKSTDPAWDINKREYYAYIKKAK